MLLIPALATATLKSFIFIYTIWGVLYISIHHIKIAENSFIFCCTFGGLYPSKTSSDTIYNTVRILYLVLTLFSLRLTVAATFPAESHHFHCLYSTDAVSRYYVDRSAICYSRLT